MIERKVTVKDSKTLLDEWRKCTNQSEKVSAQFFELEPENFQRNEVCQFTVTRIKSVFKLYQRLDGTIWKAENSKLVGRKCSPTLKKKTDMRQTKIAFNRGSQASQESRSTEPIVDVDKEDDTDDVIMLPVTRLPPVASSSSLPPPVRFFTGFNPIGFNQSRK